MNNEVLNYILNALGLGQQQPVPFVPTASEIKTYSPNPDRPSNLPQTPQLPVDQRKFVSDPNSGVSDMKQLPPQNLADGTQRWPFLDPYGYPTSSVYMRPRFLLPDQYYDPRYMTQPVSLEELVRMGYQMVPEYYLGR